MMKRVVLLSVCFAAMLSSGLALSQQAENHALQTVEHVVSMDVKQDKDTSLNCVGAMLTAASI